MPRTCSFRLTTSGASCRRRANVSSRFVDGKGPPRIRGFRSAGEKVEILDTRNRTFEQLEVARDNREQVVEIVRNAAGELADSLQLLRPQQLFLSFQLLGRVSKQTDHRHSGSVRATDDGSMSLARKCSSVLPSQSDGNLAEMVCCQSSFQPFDGVRAIEESS